MQETPEFMFGQILQRLRDGDDKMDELTAEMKATKELIRLLPCSDSQRRISAIEARQDKANKIREFSARANIKFWHMIITAFLSSILTGAITLSIAFAIR